MIPGKYDIQIWRGSTWSITLEPDGIDPAVYDEIRMQIRPPFVKGIPTKAPLLELSKANGRITLVNTDLAIKLEVSAADTVGLTFDEGVYDLELVRYPDLEAVPPRPDETVDKLIYGKVTVHGERTV